MAKYKIKDYAKALSELMYQTSPENMALVDKFVKLLEKNGQFKNAKKIIDLAEKYYLAKKGNKSIVFETARKMSVKDYFRNVINEGDFTLEKINQDLIAGVKIIINENRQLDFSLKNKLDRIFK